MSITGMKTSVSVTGALPRGFSSLHDAGKGADYFVDTSVAVSGSGLNVSSPFKTLQEAVDQVAADSTPRTVAVREGIYREAITLGASHAGMTLKGYGLDKPTLTGQEPLVGWTQCNAADAPLLGNVLGINNSPVWKVTLPNSALASSGRALNLYEQETPVPVCQTQTGDAFFFTYNKEFSQASFTLNAANEITAIVDPALLAGVTETQMAHAFAYIFHFSNRVSEVNITAFSAAKTEVRVDGKKVIQGNTPMPIASNQLWNLANCLPYLTRGTYGFTDNCDETSTIYLYPNDTAHLAGDMSYAARDTIITLEVGADEMTFEGLKLLGVAGGSNTTGICLRKTSLNVKNTGLTIRQCKMGNLTNATGKGYGALYLRFCDNATVERCTFSQVSGAVGTFFGGGANNTPANGNRLLQCHAERISRTAHRFFTQTNCQFARNDMVNNGKGGHTNLATFYEQSDTILIYGNRARNCVGYLAWQEASNIYIGCNDLQLSLESNGRGFIDQTNRTKQPSIPSLNYIWNNASLPSQGAPASAFQLGNHFKTDEGGSDQPNNISYVLINNIIHGGGIEEPYTSPGKNATHWRNQPGYDNTHIERAREGNLYTALQFWQTPAAPYFWTKRPSETVYVNLANTYGNVAENDFRVPQDSPILNMTGVDLASVIAAAQAAFPDFEFTQDADGAPIEAAAPRVGPYQRNWNAQVRWSG